MRNDILNPVTIAFNLKDLVDQLLHELTHIPLPQAVIVFTSIGLIVGHFMYESFDTILIISRYLCWLFVFGLGILTLYLLNNERRTYKSLLVFSTLMMFFVAISLIFYHEPKVVYFLINVLLIFGSVTIFLLTARNYRFTDKGVDQ